MSHAQPAAERRGSAAVTATLPGYGHAPSDRPGAREVAFAQEQAWQARTAREKAEARFFTALTVFFILAAIPLAGLEVHWLAAHVLAGR